MKAFNFNVDFSKEEFCDDCFFLYEYLNDIGKLNIDPNLIPKYYREFSEEQHNINWQDCWGDDDIKLEFAQWLSEKDV